MIPAERAHLKISALTHPGMSGKNNEDRYGVSAYRLKGDPEVPSVLAVVADGIGGHRAGEVAAELAVETISQVVAGSDGRDPIQILEKAIIQASQLILAQAETDPLLKGMGTTCACVWVIGDQLYMASVGDSRVYLIRDGDISQLTTDHTWVQEAIENGSLTLEEARSHPNAHVIRRYLGSKIEVVPDTRIRLNFMDEAQNLEVNQGFRLQRGDTVLLCSDGLTDLVKDQEILAALTGEDLDAGLERLVNQANGRGGHDNITMVALRQPITEPLAETVPITVAAPSKRFRLGASCLAAGLLLATVILALGGLFYITNRPTPTSTLEPTNNSALQATLIPQFTRTIPAGTAPSPAGPASATPTIFRPVSSTRSSPSGATLTPWPTNTRGP